MNAPPLADKTAKLIDNLGSKGLIEPAIDERVDTHTRHSNPVTREHCFHRMHDILA
jgi:hypothetical protein